MRPHMFDLFAVCDRGSRLGLFGDVIFAYCIICSEGGGEVGETCIIHVRVPAKGVNENGYNEG